MLSIGNKYFIFISSTIILFLFGSSIKIPTYEHNQLVNLNNNYSKLVLSDKSYRQIKPKQEAFFQYYKDGKKTYQKIKNIEVTNESYLLFLEGNNYEAPIINISYSLGKISVWQSIFA